MSNEITALCYQKNQQQSVVCFTPTEVFSADNFGNYFHLWEISRPRVCAPAYVDPNPCGPVPPPGSNKATSPVYNDTAKMQAFGDYHGTDAKMYFVKTVSPTHFQWSNDGGTTFSSSVLINGQAQALELGIQVRFFASSGFAGTETWTFYVFKPIYNVGGYTRWQWVEFENNLFFINELNNLRFLNKRTINTFAWSTDGVPKGRHIVKFHEHLLVSEPTFNGVYYQNMLMWSDVREYMKWDTQLFLNEADNYVFDDDMDCPENPLGITGLAELNPVRIGFGPARMCVYTSKKIYMLEYVGLPHIMQKVLLNDKVGCAFPWGLVASKHMHLFPASDNFYLMEKDGEAKPIGDRVFGAFMELLSEDITLRYKTWGYIDQVRREVWWVFCSKKSTGDFDTKVGYNYISDTWQFADANEHSFLHCRLSLTQGQQIKDDNAVIQDDNELIGGINSNNLQQYRLYGQADKRVSYEVLDTNQEIDQSLSEPYLITGDIIYDPGKIVIMDGMYIHANYDPGTCQGLEVAVSARNGIEDPIIWKLPPSDKLWTISLKENKYSWPRAEGRIFRLRFTFKKQVGALAVRKAEFFFWNEIITGLNNNSEK